MKLHMGATIKVWLCVIKRVPRVPKLGIRTGFEQLPYSIFSFSLPTPTLVLHSYPPFVPTLQVRVDREALIARVAEVEAQALRDREALDR